MRDGCAFYENDLGVVSFKKRASYEICKVVPMGSSGGTVSPDGDEVAVNSLNGGAGFGVVATDGSGLREYREVRGGVPCWSHAKSKLAVVLVEPPDVKLGILDLATKKMQTLEPRTTDRNSHFTSQCWSPDDKELLFEAVEKVQVYETEAKHLRVLATGTEPTWSPDGNWIAYRDEQHNDYYVIRPSGDGKKKLFHKGRAACDLVLVAGWTLCGLYPRGFPWAGCRVLPPDGAAARRQFGDLGRRRCCLLYWLSVGEES